MLTKDAKQKAIYLYNEYGDAIWFVERRKEFGDDKEFWDKVYIELLKIIKNAN